MSFELHPLYIGSGVNSRKAGSSGLLIHLKSSRMGLMAAAASVFFTIESLIPTPFPWIRLGLANAVTLLALKWWGFRDAATIFLVRLFLGGFLLGRFFHPLFFFSLSGGLAALITMFIFMRWEGRVFSLIGISIAGAVMHNAAQITVAFLFYIKHRYLFRLMPLFLINALIAGGLIGFLAILIDRRVQAGDV